ncbi:MAG: hypothetical protein JZU53_10435 [Paludibacter sp.]|nr:hypothetical protein [Paludibacter sp.]
MKYFLLTISLILIVYPLYGIIKCLQAFGDLSNYGIGVLAGGLLILSTGILLMRFTLKSINRKRTTK